MIRVHADSCIHWQVYYLTFETSLGWDVMEPVTYLVGLSGLIGQWCILRITMSS